MVVGVALGLLSLFLMAYAALDAATARPQDVRALPKPLWLVVIVLLPVAGAVLWFVAGRPKPGSPRAVPRVLPPTGAPTSAPDDDEAFLRDLRRRAAEQRRRAEEERRDGNPRDEGGPAATA
ncbi:MAG: PLD nuclease N-terminal domain-containing protein [Actinomycetes bacterium]